MLRMEEEEGLFHISQRSTPLKKLNKASKLLYVLLSSF